MRLEGSTSGYVQVQPAAAAGSWTLTLPTGAGTSGYVLQTNGAGVTSWVAQSSGTTTGSGTANYVVRWTSGTTLGTGVLVDTGTNVGVGTTAPVASLDVISTATTTVHGLATLQYSDSANSAQISLYKARGTAASPTAVQSGDALGSLVFRGYDGTNAWSSSNASYGGFVRVVTAEAWSSSAHGAYMDFYVTPVGTTAYQQAMKIDSSGKVGIGTTSPGATLDVNGPVHTGSATMGASCSDYTEGSFAYDMSVHMPIYCDNNGNWQMIGVSPVSNLSFASVTGQIPSTVVTASSTPTWSGIPLSASVTSCTGTNCYVSCNGSAYASNCVLSSGQTLSVKQTMSSSPGTTTTAMVTLGSGTATFSATTSTVFTACTKTITTSLASETNTTGVPLTIEYNMVGGGGGAWDSETYAAALGGNGTTVSGSFVLANGETLAAYVGGGGGAGYGGAGGGGGAGYAGGGCSNGTSGGFGAGGGSSAIIHNGTDIIIAAGGNGGAASGYTPAGGGTSIGGEAGSFGGSAGSGSTGGSCLSSSYYGNGGTSTSGGTSSGGGTGGNPGLNGGAGAGTWGGGGGGSYGGGGGGTYDGHYGVGGLGATTNWSSATSLPNAAGAGGRTTYGQQTGNATGGNAGLVILTYTSPTTGCPL